MPKRKTHAVKEISATGRPDLIWNYDPITGSGPLHISDKSCEHGGQRKSLTRCGRPMYPDHHTWEMSGRDVGSFRLCKRCGTADEFAQAYAEHHEWQAARNVEEAARREQEKRERDAKWESTVARVRKFASFLIAVGLRVGVKDGVALVEFDGYEYKVTESGPTPEAGRGDL